MLRVDANLERAAQTLLLTLERSPAASFLDVAPITPAPLHAALTSAFRTVQR
jgi:hypothetical protein